MSLLLFYATLKADIAHSRKEVIRLATRNVKRTKAYAVGIEKPTIP